MFVLVARMLQCRVGCKNSVNLELIGISESTGQNCYSAIAGSIVVLSSNQT